MRAVVVGGGVTGASAALALAEAGAAVAVIERWHPAAMASGWTLAGVRQSGRDPAELPLARAAAAIWITLDERLGAPTGYRRTGNLRLARNEGEARAIRAMVAEQRALGLKLEVVEGGALREIAPALAPGIRLASYCPSDGQAEPRATVDAYRAAGERLGVAWRLGTRATGLAVRGGRLRGVETAEGVMEADACVLAAGVQTNALLEPLGLVVPMTVRLVAAMRTRALPPLLGPVIGVAGADLAIRQEAGGALRFTGGVEAGPVEIIEGGGAPRIHPPAASVAAVDRAGRGRAARARPGAARRDLGRGDRRRARRAAGARPRTGGGGCWWWPRASRATASASRPAVGPALVDLAMGRPRPDLASFRMDRHRMAVAEPALHG